MNYRLPEGCEFVIDEGDINNSHLERLFGDVAKYSEPGDFRPGAFVEEPDTDDTQRFYLGVVDQEWDDRLIAYASATMRDGHATVDMCVVNPLDRGRGIGMAMAARGIEHLQKVGAQAISFVVEHDSINLMVPKLVDQYGFSYVENENEYARLSEDDKPVYVPQEFESGPSPAERNPDIQEPIGRDQRIAFKKRVSDLLSEAFEYTGTADVPDGLVFKDGYNYFRLAELVDDSGNLEWSVKLSCDEQAVHTPEGIRFITGQTYNVTETSIEDEPTESGYSELRNDLNDSFAILSEHFENFTPKRFEEIMPQLNRLTVANLDDPIFDDFISVSHENDSYINN